MQHINLLFGLHGYCLVKQSSLDSNGSWYLAEQFLAAANVAQTTWTYHATTVCLNIANNFFFKIQFWYLRCCGCP